MSAEFSYPDIPGQRLLPLVGADVRIRIGPEPAGVYVPHGPPLLAEDVESRWNTARLLNPRLRDGPVLSVGAIDAAAGTIGVCRSTYKELVAQDGTLDLGVRMLGVKGLIVGRDRAGTEHVLIARRGNETRVYGGMWEIAPAGGVSAPPGTVSELGVAALQSTLADEAREELGLELDVSAARPIAIVRDDVARSVDVIVRLDWPWSGGVIDPRASVCRLGRDDWEYVDTAFLSRTDAAAFDARAAGEIVGPMRVALRWLGRT